jgi:pimeloyl-ACP methyl ester carboxylesterase
MAGWLIGVLAGLGILIVLLIVGVNLAFNTDRVPDGTVRKTAISKDGTRIVYEQTGHGPTLILVSAALADRSGNRRLAAHLARRFTVINYDRRGRGDSTDTQPYAPEREMEDIDALIDASGTPAFLFGSSSGAVLALDAASRLGPKVKRLFLYEPPLIVDNSRPPLADNLKDRVAALTAAGHRNEAVKLFFTEGMGIPSRAVTVMQWLMPGWSKMARMAPTLRYDLTILSGTQNGGPLPDLRWTGDRVATLVMVGSRSEPFFHHGAQALAKLLANGQYKALEGRDHSAVLFAPKALAAAVETFLFSGGSITSPPRTEVVHQAG